MEIMLTFDFWVGFAIDRWYVLLICAVIIVGTIIVFNQKSNYCAYDIARPYILTFTVRRAESDDGSDDPDKFFKEYRALSQFINIYEDYYKSLLRRARLIDAYGCININDLENASIVLYNFRSNFLKYAVA